jgi:hypothetical protein
MPSVCRTNPDSFQSLQIDPADEEELASGDVVAGAHWLAALGQHLSRLGGLEGGGWTDSGLAGAHGGATLHCLLQRRLHGDLFARHPGDGAAGLGMRGGTRGGRGEGRPALVGCGRSCSAAARQSDCNGARETGCGGGVLQLTLRCTRDDQSDEVVASQLGVHLARGMRGVRVRRAGAWPA